MEVGSPLRNGMVAALTYAGVALAVASKDPQVAYYLVQSGARGVKTFARTEYNKKLELQTQQGKEEKLNTVA